MLQRKEGVIIKISSRFSIAVHCLLCIAKFHEHKVTSEFLARSVNVNPVIIRKVLGQLKKAGLIDVFAGCGGTVLIKQPDNITLLDIYRATLVVNEDSMFNFHEEPNQKCLVGRNIHNILDSHLLEAQSALENSLHKTNLQDLLIELDKRD